MYDDPRITSHDITYCATGKGRAATKRVRSSHVSERCCKNAVYIYIYGLLISEATVRLSSFPPHHHCDAGYTYFLNDIVCDCFDRIEALEMAAAQEQARMDTLRAAHARELEEQCRDRLSLEQKVSQSHRPSRLASVCSQSSPSSHPLSCETIKLGEERHTVESLRMSLKASEEKLSRLVRSLYRRDRERGIKQAKKNTTSLMGFSSITSHLSSPPPTPLLG